MLLVDILNQTSGEAPAVLWTTCPGDKTEYFNAKQDIFLTLVPWNLDRLKTTVRLALCLHSHIELQRCIAAFSRFLWFKLFLVQWNWIEGFLLQVSDHHNGNHQFYIWALCMSGRRIYIYIICDNVSKVHTCTQNHNPCSFCSVLCNEQFDLVFYQHLMALKAASAAFSAAKGHSPRAWNTIRSAPFLHWCWCKAPVTCLVYILDSISVWQTCRLLSAITQIL